MGPQTKEDYLKLREKYVLDLSDTSETLTASTATVTEFYNDCHAPDGTFCETPGGPHEVTRQYERRDMFRRKVRDNLTHLSDEEQKAVLSYQSDYVDLNNYFRHPSRVALAYYDNQIKGIDAAMKKSTTGEDLVVYRGIGGRTGDRVSNLEVGQRFSDKGYVSTAGTTAVADLFGSTRTWKIIVPKGTHAIALGGGERELVLDRNTKFEKVDEKTLRVVTT